MYYIFVADDLLQQRSIAIRGPGDPDSNNNNNMIILCAWWRLRHLFQSIRGLVSVTIRRIAGYEDDCDDMIIIFLTIILRYNKYHYCAGEEERRTAAVHVVLYFIIVWCSKGGKRVDIILCIRIVYIYIYTSCKHHRTTTTTVSEKSCLFILNYD